MKELTKKNYEAPNVRIVKVIVEKGFAASGAQGSSTEEMTVTQRGWTINK